MGVGRAPIDPPAVLEPHAVLIHAHHIGVTLRHPRRVRRRRGSQADIDAVLGQQIEQPVEPLKVIAILRRLQLGPRKDGHGGYIDVRRLHQPHIVLPDRFRELVRIIVAAEPKGREFGVEHREPPQRILVLFVCKLIICVARLNGQWDVATNTSACR